MKIVRQYYKEKGEIDRLIFVSREQSYHGYTIGAMSLSESSRKAPFREVTLAAWQAPKVAPCYPYRHNKDGESLEKYKDRLLKEVEETFLSLGPYKIAAFVCETLPDRLLELPLRPRVI